MASPRTVVRFRSVHALPVRAEVLLLPSDGVTATVVGETQALARKKPRTVLGEPRRALAAAGRRRPCRVLCYGDSNTAGFCENGLRFEPYGDALSKALSAGGVPCKVSVCGLSGRRAVDMVAALDAPAIPDVVGRPGRGLRRLLREARPDVVLLMAGTNDLGTGATPEATLMQVARLHDVCHRLNVPTVCVAPPAVPRQRGARRRLAWLLEAFARRTPGVVHYLDAEEAVPRAGADAEGAALWERDELHFSPAGSRRLGEHLAAVVAKLPPPSMDRRQSLHSIAPKRLSLAGQW